MWKRVSEVVTSVKDEGTRVVKSFPTEEISQKVSKLATASNEEFSRYSTLVKKETNKLSNNIDVVTRCQACDQHISAALAVTKVKELVKCSVCGIKCCAECIEWSVEDIPDDMWHDVEQMSKSSDGRGPYCTIFCRSKLVNFWLTRSCTMRRQDFLDTLELYLSHSKIEKISKPFATKDGHYRKGKRILTLAEYAANVIGYKAVFHINSNSIFIY